jgi:hypothetical protein
MDPRERVQVKCQLAIAFARIHNYRRARSLVQEARKESILLPDLALAAASYGDIDGAARDFARYITRGGRVFLFRDLARLLNAYIDLGADDPAVDLLRVALPMVSVSGASGDNDVSDLVGICERLLVRRGAAHVSAFVGVRRPCTAMQS